MATTPRTARLPRTCARPRRRWAGRLPSWATFTARRSPRARSIPRSCDSGRRVVLVGGPRGAADEIEVSHPELVDALRVGDRVLIDDGRIELVVRATSKGRAECSVIRGGLLGERKGVSVPGRPLPLPALTEKDVEDLKFAVGLGVDYIALSFVRHPEDVLACQKELSAHRCH